MEERDKINQVKYIFFMQKNLYQFQKLLYLFFLPIGVV